MTLSDPPPSTGEHPGGPRHGVAPYPAVASGVREHLASDSSGHDTHHAWRVFRLAQRFASELDADNLDAMGAVGIARTFAFGGVHGTPLWDPDGEEYSQLYHFEDKLLRLREELHTEPARELAAERHAFLETFYERFRAEWCGEE